MRGTYKSFRVCFCFQLLLRFAGLGVTILRTTPPVPLFLHAVISEAIAIHSATSSPAYNWSSAHCSPNRCRTHPSAFLLAKLPQCLAGCMSSELSPAIAGSLIIPCELWQVMTRVHSTPFVELCAHTHGDHHDDCLPLPVSCARSFGFVTHSVMRLERRERAHALVCGLAADVT